MVAVFDLDSLHMKYSLGRTNMLHAFSTLDFAKFHETEEIIRV